MTFTKAEDKTYRKILGDSVRNHKSQRDAMREVYGKLESKEKTIKAYAWLEEKGCVQRKKNTNSLSAMDYAKAFLKDGINKGWLCCKKS